MFVCIYMKAQYIQYIISYLTTIHIHSESIPLQYLHLNMNLPTKHDQVTCIDKKNTFVCYANVEKMSQNTQQRFMLKGMKN